VREARIEARQTADGPPLLPFALSIGVTGHRSDALPDAARMRERIRAALALLRITAEAVHGRDAEWFTPDPMCIQLVSPLADGADQIAAEAALDLGFGLHAVLPFARAVYRPLLVDEGARRRFDALLGRADCVLELPGYDVDGADAYVMTGRATVAHCDLLLAVWDGLSPRGRGGTSEIVQLAIARGTPVIHIRTDPALPDRILWAAFDPAVLTVGDDVMAERPFDRDTVDALLTALVTPPPDPQERRFIKIFGRERVRRIRARIEYPLLLAAAGVKRFRIKDQQEWRARAAIDAEWRCYRDNCARPHAIEASLELLERSYSWSDRLATHFAQTYRSGHVFNFVLGGFAVCLGLSTFMLPHARVALALTEFFITLAIILNTFVGARSEWHRRWLDYRQLAERLRPMRSLKLLGIAAPDPPGTATNPVARRWIDWYSSAMWRAMGCPAGSFDTQRADVLATAIAEYEIAPQVAYHAKNARQIEAFDQRLESIATALFGATLVVCVASVGGLLFAPELVKDFNNWFQLISSGFPALGTAIFGIRFQGDFGGTARRSESTAHALRRIDAELRKEVTLSRAADLAEQAARTMLADLDEWRLTNQLHDLSVG
jgi:hypothetical protein